MEISAGLLIRCKEKILLCRAKNSDVYGPPKGGVERGETIMQAAIRETWEEVGIYVDKSKINPNPLKFEYDNWNGEIFKIVWIFIVDVDNLLDLRLMDWEVPKSQLQAKEISWAGFLNKEEASKVIFRRFKILLDYI
jgi:8-oxo-dGTP pyrophosphatase MutT (NUDIX family)